MFYFFFFFFFFFSSRRRHTRYWRDWSSDVCSSDLGATAAMPCLPGDGVFVSGWARAATAARGFRFGANFYDAGSNFLGTVYGTANGDATTGWSFASGQVTAPPGSALALPVVQVQATGAAAEVHDIDDVTMSGRGSVLLQTQVFTVTGINPPFAGFQGVNFTPAAATNTVLSNAAIQTGPPKLPALTLWAGFGSTGFYQHWARLGGRVTLAVTLTDTYSTTLGFSKTVKVTGSNNSLAPRWNKVRIPVPYKPGFD